MNSEVMGSHTMEKLIVLTDDGPADEFTLKDQRISIGRDETNMICLGDKSVSRHHATLQRVFRGFSLEDEGSTNGTRVNGKPITKQFLNHGDLIEIGKYHLRYYGSEEIGESDDPDRTVVLRPVHQSQLKPPPATPRPVHQSELKPPPATEQPARQSELKPPPVTAQPVRQSELKPPPVTAQPVRQSELKPPPVTAQPVRQSEPKPSPATAQPAPAASVVQGPKRADAKVRFLSGSQQGEELTVDRAFFTVGKPGGDLVLINRRHTGYFLLKVGGENSPMINGNPIKAGGVELHNGDRIDLGELSLEFVS